MKTKDKETFRLFLKQEYSFHPRLGKIEFNRKQEERNDIEDIRELLKSCPDEMRSLYKEMYDERKNLKNCINDYLEGDIELSYEKGNVKDIVYWKDGKGVFLEKLIEMPLKPVGEYLYQDMDSQYRELEKSLIEGNYPSKKEIEELCRNYRIAIKKEEEKISDNENCIKKFITTYGLLYVDAPGREYRRKLREIEEEILCQILTEEERDGKEKIFQEPHMFSQSMSIQKFIEIQESFCFLNKIHSSLVNRKNIEGKELFIERVNLFLQYLTWNHFFVGINAPINIMESFADLNRIHTKYVLEILEEIKIELINQTEKEDINKKDINDLNRLDIEKIILKQELSLSKKLRVLITKDEEKIDLSNHLKEKYIEYLRMISDSELEKIKERFSNLEKVLDFFCNKAPLKYNLRGYCEIDKYEDEVDGEVQESIYKLLSYILQDIVNTSLSNLKSIFELDIKNKNVKFMPGLKAEDALKIEFAFNIISNITFEQCGYCKAYFMPSSRKKVMCCPGKCTDNYLKRKKRKSEKYYKKSDRR